MKFDLSIDEAERWLKLFLRGVIQAIYVHVCQRVLIDCWKIQD